MSTMVCKCLCGHTRFTVKGPAKLRMICHCTICQKFNESSFADILVYKSKQVSSPAEGSVIFSTYKPPPNVKRGKCTQCGQPVIEIFNMPLMPKLTMVPSEMLLEGDDLPKPAAHMFYEKRLADAHDEIPKKTGFISSQLSFFKCLWFS